MASPSKSKLLARKAESVLEEGRRARPALLDGAAQPLQAEAGGRVLLVDPLAPGVLRGRGADLQAGWPRRELRAGEAAARGAADGRELKAGGEGGEDQESRRGRGCGACMWR